MEWLERAVAAGPNDPVRHVDLGEATLHHHLGRILRILGRTGEARASYLRAIRVNPDLTLSYLHVGITLRLEGDLENALKWHELAVETEPDNPAFLDELADLYLKRDEPDKAVECRQRLVLLLPPERVDARLDLGAALQDDGRPAGHISGRRF